MRAWGLLMVGLCGATMGPAMHANAQTTPLTMGRVALLAARTGPADAAALTAAIDDPDPGVRAVAARVAGILNRFDLAAPLDARLGIEQDAGAAREQLRALLYLRSGEALLRAKAAATRLGPGGRSVLAEWIGRNRPDLFADSLREVMGDTPEQHSAVFGGIAAMTARQSPPLKGQIAQALAAVAPVTAWTEFLDRLDVDADARVVQAGLMAPSGAVRETTSWRVLTNPVLGSLLTPEDMKKAMAGGAPDDSPWARLGRELLARRAGQAASLDGSPILADAAETRQAEIAAILNAPELTNAERAAAQGALKNKKAAGRPGGTGAKRPEAEPRVPQTTRTFRLVAPGFLRSLLAAVGCTPGAADETYGAARIAYLRDGRPRTVAVDATTLPPSCVEVPKVLGMLAVADPDVPVVDEAAQWLFLPMHADAVACADAPTGAAAGNANAHGTERVDGSRIKAPVKTRDVRPVYPDFMIRDRRSGTVTIGATISETGCVARAEVTRSAELPLDAAALRAVSLWRFTPTLVDGKPVPVTMTVTINFSLQ